MDSSYRADLRELNDLNFARFDAKLEQRVSGLEAKMEQRVSGLEAKMEWRIGILEAKMEQRFEAIERTLERRLGEHLRWQFLTWSLLLVPIIGLWFK